VKTVTENFYVAKGIYLRYTLDSYLKSWDMRLVTRERCYRKIPSAVKIKMQEVPLNKETCMCTRTLAGNSSLWSVIPNVSSPGKNGRGEAGMGHKGFYNFL